jgi:hypothetical protein
LLTPGSSTAGGVFACCCFPLLDAQDLSASGLVFEGTGQPSLSRRHNFPVSIMKLPPRSSCWFHRSICAPAPDPGLRSWSKPLGSSATHTGAGSRTALVSFARVGRRWLCYCLIRWLYFSSHMHCSGASHPSLDSIQAANWTWFSLLLERLF